MSSTRKAILGILSFLPLILSGIWLYFYVRWIMDFIPNAHTYDSNPNLVMQNIGDLLGITFSIMIPTGLLTIGLMIYYIIQIVNSKILPDTERIIWIIVIVIFNTLAFPIYWIMRIRNLPAKGTVLVPTPDAHQGPTYG